MGRGMGWVGVVGVVVVVGCTSLCSLTSINIDILRPSRSSVCPQSLRELPPPGTRQFYRANLPPPFFARSLKRWIIYSSLPDLSVYPSLSFPFLFFLLTRLNAKRSQVGLNGSPCQADGKMTSRPLMSVPALRAWVIHMTWRPADYINLT